jgi:hypothetical protein
MKKKLESDTGSNPPACSRLSDVETELRAMADRCRQPAPSAAVVLELAADIVGQNGKNAAEVIRLRNAIRNLRDVKGRHHTQIATEQLFALLPENEKSDPR